MPSDRSSAKQSKQNKPTHPHYRQPPHVAAAVVNAYLKAVADHFQTTPGRMLSQRLHGGGPPGSQPIQRQVAIFLLRRNTGIHLDILARRFQRSRTTIIRSLVLVERKTEAKAKVYLEAIAAIDGLLERAGLTGSCDRCGQNCTPGPLCWKCDTLLTSQYSLTNGASAHTNLKSGRNGGAGRTDMPPGREPDGPKAQPPSRRSATGGFKSRR
jgi:hypothetical protein